MLPELEALARYRLDHDLTWAQLSSEMRAANAYVSPNGLFKHVQAHAQMRRGPYERTLHKIRKFLAIVLPIDARAAKRAAARASTHRRARVAGA